MNLKCEKLYISGYSSMGVNVEIKGLHIEEFIKSLSPEKIKRILEEIGEDVVINHFDFELACE